MTPAQALHVLLRRRVAAEFDRWISEYMHTGAADRPQSAEAHGIFPRYLVHQAMLNALERFEPAGLPPVPVAREQLAAALLAASDRATLNVDSHPIARAAMAEERAAMANVARTASEAELAQVEPLLYRRVLSDEEEVREWRAVSERWGIAPGYWYPLSDPTVPGLKLIAFDAPEFRRDVGPALDELLGAQGVRRVLEFREGGPARELALELLDPLYDGLEGFWTARGADWILYASHEGSMTVAGTWLIEAVKARWPAWQSHVWEFGSWEDTTARGAT